VSIWICHLSDDALGADSNLIDATVIATVRKVQQRPASVRACQVTGDSSLGHSLAGHTLTDWADCFSLGLASVTVTTVPLSDAIRLASDTEHCHSDCSHSDCLLALL
jgi:hypothetical protein